MLLSHAGIPFDDIRIDPSDWPKVKPLLNGNSLPILELPDGMRLHQSKSIMRLKLM